MPAATWGSWRSGDAPPPCTRPRSACSSGSRGVERCRPLRTYPDPSGCGASSAPATHQAVRGHRGRTRQRRKGSSSRTRAHSSPVTGCGRSTGARARGRRALVVNERHPERNADVVLFLDSFAEARGRSGARHPRPGGARRGHASRRIPAIAGTASGSSRSAASCAGSSLAAALVQRYRLLDALLETRVRFSYAWKDVNVIPARTLPPRALVIAVTPLLDDRESSRRSSTCAHGARPRRGRGRRPYGFVRPGRRALDDVAHRLWRLRRTRSTDAWHAAA